MVSLHCEVMMMKIKHGCRFQVRQNYSQGPFDVRISISLIFHPSKPNGGILLSFRKIPQIKRCSTFIVSLELVFFFIINNLQVELLEKNPNQCLTYFFLNSTQVSFSDGPRRVPALLQSGGTPLILRITFAIRLASPGLGSSMWKLLVRRLYKEP